MVTLTAKEFDVKFGTNVEGRPEPRFMPYGGAGPLPTECCEFAVVDTVTGQEVCRVWKEEDALRIAYLLERENEQPK